MEEVRLSIFMGFAFATVIFTSKLGTLKPALLPSGSTAGLKDKTQLRELKDIMQGNEHPRSLCWDDS